MRALLMVFIMASLSSWILSLFFFFFFSSRRRHTRSLRDWSSDVCSSDLDRRRGRAGLHDLALDGPVLPVENLDPLAPDHRPVALVEIGNPLRPGCDRQRVRAEVILAFAITDGERRAAAGGDDEVRVIAEQDRNGEGAGQARQDGRDRFLRRSAALDLARDEMPDHLGVGLALELASFGDQLVPE